MTTAQIVLLAVPLYLAALFAGCWGWSVWRRYEGRSRVRGRVLVNLTDGSAYSGVLWSRTGEWLVLRHAEKLEQGAEPLPFTGEVLVERRGVESVQVLA